jgi:hypothetical protein
MSPSQQYNILFDLFQTAAYHATAYTSDHFLLPRLPSIMVGPILVHCFLERLEREF